MAKFINSEKYDGVQHYIKADGTKTYYIRYRDETKKLKRVKVGTEDDGTDELYCKNKRIEVLNAINKGEQPPKIVKTRREDIIRFDDIADLYFESKEDTRSTGDRKSKYNKHIKPEIGSFPISYITSEHLEEIKSKLINSKNLSKKTVNMVLELFSTIFNYGFKRSKYNLTNPASRVERFIIKNTRERYLRKPEVDALYLEVIKEDQNQMNGKMLEVFVKLALTTGARMGGVLNIKKSDIDFDNDIIRVVDFKKGGDIYSAYISATTRELLREVLSKVKFSDYIVSLNMSGKKLGERKLQNKLKPILDRLFNQELEVNDRKNRIVIHSLRHTFASHLAVADIPLKQIQMLMNHSDIKETMKYAKLQDNENKTAMQKVFL